MVWASLPAHGDAGDVDRTVADGFHGKIFLAGLLAPGGELGDRAAGSGFRHLAASVGVGFGVEDEDFDVFAGAEDVVEPAEADVVGPAVSADQPDTLAGERIGYGEESAGFGRVDSGELGPERKDALALGFDAGLSGLVGGEECGYQLIAERCGEGLKQGFGVFLLLVQGETDAQAELRVVFEERVGPGGTAAALVDAVGCGRKASSIDGRAAGSVGDEEAIAEELGEQLDVGRLATAGASARELEERVEELDVLDLVVREAIAINGGQGLEVGPVLDFGLAEWSLRHHLESFVLWLGLADGRADLHAEVAAGAVFRGDLQGVQLLFHAAPLGPGGFEGRGRVRKKGQSRRPWRG